jgi:hypothetical protein
MKYIWFPASFPDAACRPPAHSAAFANPDGLNTSYLRQQGGGRYSVDVDDPASSPGNS